MISNPLYLKLTPSPAWSLLNNSGLPDINRSKTNLGPLNPTGEFSSILSGLEGNKTYYFRTYVVANSVLAYGNEKAFITEENTGNRVRDEEGNIYHHKTLDSY